MKCASRKKRVEKKEDNLFKGWNKGKLLRPNLNQPVVGVAPRWPWAANRSLRSSPHRARALFSQSLSPELYTPHESALVNSSYEPISVFIVRFKHPLLRLPFAPVACYLWSSSFFTVSIANRVYDSRAKECRYRGTNPSLDEISFSPDARFRLEWLLHVRLTTIRGQSSRCNAARPVRS